MHAYVREIELGREDDSLSRIAAMIEPGSRVLDVGTGSGSLGAFLSRHKDCVVDGITANPEEAAMACADYRTIWVCDLNGTLPAAMLAASYDVIVCADVLEHLDQPEALLRALRDQLVENGRLLLSVPNVTFLGVRLNLLFGRFARTREGILDSTHRQFWDRPALAALCAAAGFDVLQAGAVQRNLLASEFSAFDVLSVPPQVRDYVCAGVDADVYQFLWTLVPNGGEQSRQAEPPALPPTQTIPQFLTEMHWDCGEGFRADLRAGVTAEMREGIQILSFDLPALSVCAMRLDVADRPGTLEVVQISAYDQSGTLQVRWEPDAATPSDGNDCEWAGVRGPFGGWVLHATSNDPWFVVPIPRGALAKATRVEVELTCPMRYGSVAFDASRNLVERLRRELDAMACQRDADRNQAEGVVADLRLQLAELCAAAEANVSRADQKAAMLQAELNAIHATRTWRLRQWLHRGWSHWLGRG